MKKAVRIIIPILLALAIVFCLGWYLFSYDREFTRDMLLQSARYFEDKNRHETSAWFYNLAYKQADNNDQVAIELAQQHKDAGNYTKAEYVLNQAIAEGASEDLYIALCKTYVEQDKLLDAVKLLDTVCREDSRIDPAVRDALISRRPATPTANPATGFYNQYISVTLEAETGTLYAIRSNEYPSIHANQYIQPIQLVAGENVINALAVSEEGLVSPLGIFGYTVGGVIEEVNFADPAMESAIRTLLGVSKNTIVYSDDLWGITEFTVPSGTKNFSDLKFMKDLEKLTIDSGASGQLGNISSMSHLREIYITNTSVSAEEVSLIGTLPNLKKLTLSDCGLSTVAGLKNATGITYLDLSGNTIRNIDALSSMKGLQELNLQQNALSDLSALSACSALKILDVSGNALTSLAPISGISGLTILNADRNQITQLGNISQLSSLSTLTLSYNQLTDISMLSSNVNLKILDISNNALTDITMLSSLTKLEHFNFSYNQIAVIPTWEKNCALISIDGSHNLIESLKPLAGLRSLNAISMDYNEKISSIAELAECYLLITVSVYGTNVTEIEALTDRSVVVHYNPTN